jgi:hypothetical protein
MKHLNSSIIVLCLLSLSQENVFSQNCLSCEDTPLASDDNLHVLKSDLHLIQLFGDYSFRTTNLYEKSYNDKAGWIESRIIFPYLSKFLQSDSAKISLPDIFITAVFKDAKEDLTGEKMIYYGFGAEWRPLSKNTFNIPPINWIKHLRFYVEKLWGYYYQDVECWRSVSDLRLGVELYRECNLYDDINVKNKKDYHVLWSEFWADFSYRQTNFYDDNYSSWIFGFVPKLGVKIFPDKVYTLMPYIIGEIGVTGREEAWQNRFLIGIGLRLMPFRELKSSWAGTIFKACKIYIQGMRNIVYFKSPPKQYTPPCDLIFGVNFSINRIN